MPFDFEARSYNATSFQNFSLELERTQPSISSNTTKAYLQALAQLVQRVPPSREVLS
eukprot:c15680_g1_i1 orf=527-697(+)